MAEEVNDIFKLAADLVNNTSQSIFLTGKAGTGKTTFLRYIKENTSKNTIVAAPTGVAAINAGGTTIHSLFQLPFEPFIPDNSGNGIRKLSHHFRMHKNKIEMFRELELLIIDEVSMLRADILDAIDVALKHFRRNHLPFGGVQMLYIGDLFQLPPVVQDEEWNLLKDYYKTPFFFHAKSIEQSFPLYIELKKIYRQNEQNFIEILNQVRNNNITNESLQRLNARYFPDFAISENSNYVVLSTHNYKTERINQAELNKLPEKVYKYQGIVKGNFSESSFPTEQELVLKKHAQVMFIKNDTGEIRRFYNGKLGKIITLDEDVICVELEGSGLQIELERETWRNVRYTLNKETNVIEEEELGSFTQFPIRLAWAITIHKSQGLTFQHAVIDAGQAFAAGQVYVALSRCTTLEGIVLRSRITPDCIKTDPEIVSFSKKENKFSELQGILSIEQPKYLRKKLIQVFEWKHLLESCTTFAELVSEKTLPDMDAALKLALAIKSKAYEEQAIAAKFQEQLANLISQFEETNDITRLKDRVQKAIIYFHQDISENIRKPLVDHLESLKRVHKVKQYTNKLKAILIGIESFLSKLEHVSYGNIPLIENVIFEKPEINVEPEKQKVEKGSSHKISLEMFREGKNIQEIATERNLAQSTIEGHLCSFVRTGEVELYALVSEEKVKKIQPLLENLEEKTKITPIKQQLGDDYSYAEIRAVLNHLLFIAEKEK